MKTIAKYVSAGILAVLLGGDAIAEDIYSQTFAASPPIVGTTSTTGGGTWAGSNIIDLNGNTTGVDGAVSLPFTPQSGFVYELTATIDVTAANGSWVGVGFLESNNAYGFFGAPTTPTALRTSGWQTFAGPGANYTQTSNEVLIRLDTTGAQWTVAMFQGGVQMGDTYTYTTNPTINHVGFVSEGTAVGSVSAINLTAGATVIYSQTFAGSLVGTTPTTGSGTWAGTNIIMNGNTTGEDGAVSLPFTPQSGFIYDLTATIDVIAANGSWLGVGFLESNNAYGFLGSPKTPTALRTSGWQTWAGPAANYPQTSNEVLIRLDTTGAQWTVAMFQGGVQMGDTYTYTTNPTINWVGFVSEGTAVGSVSAFQLTAVSNSPTFATWASTNAGGQTANLDWDNDGVTNGVEFFMNAAAGFTANPGLVGNTVTWSNGGNISASTYGTQFVVQTSSDLVIWEDVAEGDLNTNTSGPAGSLSYSVDPANGPAKQFVRLKVTPN
jgi:hypothetical protein